MEGALCEREAGRLGTAPPQARRRLGRREPGRRGKRAGNGPASQAHGPGSRGAACEPIGSRRARRLGAGSPEVNSRARSVVGAAVVSGVEPSGDAAGSPVAEPASVLGGLDVVRARPT